MPRLRNRQTGAVVSCSDETAARLGAGWVPADKATPKKATPRKAAAVKNPEASDK